MTSRGHTLTELLAFIIVVGIISGGVFLVAKRVDSARSTAREAEQFQVLVDAIDRSWGMPTGHFTGLTAAEVIRLELAPAPLLAGSQLRSQWGTITLGPVDIGTRRLAGFWVNYAGIPEAACLAFVRGTYKSAREVQVNGYVVASVQDSKDGAHVARQSVLDDAALDGACSRPSSRVLLGVDAGHPGTRSHL